MNEMLFYVGLVCSILFFLLSGVFFIYYKIPKVIMYFLKMRGKRNIRVSTSKKVEINHNVDLKEGWIAVRTEARIEARDEEKTELLQAVHTYATALLEADNTVLLPCLKE